jgi:hypothetical protein
MSLPVLIFAIFAGTVILITLLRAVGGYGGHSAPRDQWRDEPRKSWSQVSAEACAAQMAYAANQRDYPREPVREEPMTDWQVRTRAVREYGQMFERGAEFLGRVDMKIDKAADRVTYRHKRTGEVLTHTLEEDARGYEIHVIRRGRKVYTCSEEEAAEFVMEWSR